MKTSTWTVGTWHFALAWCLSTAAGRFLYQKQAPTTATSAQALAHIALSIERLKEESAAAVAVQNNEIGATVLKKQNEAKIVIEKEIPVAAAADTQELAKDVAEEEAGLQKALDRSTKESEEALGILKEKTTKAVAMSTVKAVSNVVEEAEIGAKYIANHSLEMELEATALAKEANGAANFSQQAAENSALWVKELPVEDANDAVILAKKSQKESVKLRHEYEDVKRIAKLSGNLALDTLKISQEAVALSKKASDEATMTMEQAAQNALLLNTIRQQTNEASQTSLTVIAAER